MKSIIIFLFILSSIVSYAGDKGNGLDSAMIKLDSSSLEKLMSLGLEVEENLYPLMFNEAEAEVALTTANPQIKIFVSLVGELINREEWEILSSLTSENENFYQAFGVNNAQAENKILLEKFWVAAKEALIPSIGISNWKKFSSSVNTQKLGLKIE